VRGRLTARLTIPVVLVSLALVAGCGDDDDDGNGGGGTTPPAQTATTETTEPTTTEEPAAGAEAPTKEAMESCLAEADLELRDKEEEFTNAEGETKTREDLDIDDTAYLGYVQWPSKSVADVYVSTDEAAAEKAEREAGLFIKAFGLDPAKYVKRAGTVVMTFDDPPPTAEEAKAVEGCATG
jgi:hypothetical protein